MKIFHIKAADASLEMERRFADLVRALAALGIGQHIIMSHHPELETLFESLGIPCTVQKFSGLFDLRTLQAAQQIVESFGPHLIQTHSAGAVTLAAKIQFNAVRVGFTSADEAQQKRTLAASDIVLAVQYFQHGTGLDYDILPVPPLVADLCPAALPPPPGNENPIIGCLLDMNPAYRPEPVFQAMRDIPGLRLLVCGRGGAQKDWQNAARRQAVHDRIEFAEVPSSDVRDFLVRLDLCVVPFRTGGIDRLTLEAWSCGVCVLSGMPAERSPIDHEVNGVLTDGGDVLGWRKHITALLGDKALRDRLGYAGRETYLKSHTEKRAVSSYLQAYETALRVKA